MYRRILITGAAGTGTSTLGKELAIQLGYSWFDLDDFYWAPDKPEYSIKRTIEERHKLLENATRDHPAWILSGSLMTWGDFLVPQLDLVVFLYSSPDIRIQRLQQREQERYGQSISPGGEREKQFNAFINWSASYDQGNQEGRSLAKHQEWLSKLNCKVLRLDSSTSREELLAKVLSHVNSL